VITNYTTEPGDLMTNGGIGTSILDKKLAANRKEAAISIVVDEHSWGCQDRRVELHLG
jgi:hypothetical protein